MLKYDRNHPYYQWLEQLFGWGRKSYPQEQARGKILTQLVGIHGIKRRWYEVPYILDCLLRRRYIKYMRNYNMRIKNLFRRNVADEYDEYIKMEEDPQ